MHVRERFGPAVWARALKAVFKESGDGTSVGDR